MITPSKHSVSMASMSPMDHNSSQRISLSLSDLVSPGLREFDEETKTSANSGTDAANYKRELKKLLTKSRGTAYEATLRRFVEAKYNEIKKDEASNRKMYGHPKGPAFAAAPSIASMSKSKYDPPNATYLQANALELHNTYQDGRIVENNVNASFSQPYSPYQSKSYARNSDAGSTTGTAPNNSSLKRPLYGHGNSMGYSILNEVSMNSAKHVSLDVTPHNKSRIEEMAKPMERNVYKGPPAASPFGSTNHLGRQRPPPQSDAKSPERRPVSASPYSSPYRKRKANAAAADKSGTAASVVADDFASVTSFPDQFKFLGELDKQDNSKSYQEFRQWLANNRNWMRKCENKVQSKSEEVLRDTTNDFKPKILAKSVRLADIANKRDFKRIASMSGALHSDTDAPQLDGFQSLGQSFNLGDTTRDSRSRSRSPTRSPSPNMRMVYDMAATVNAHLSNSGVRQHHEQSSEHSKTTKPTPAATNHVVHSSHTKLRSDSTVSESTERPLQKQNHSNLRSFSKDSVDELSVQSHTLNHHQHNVHHSAPQRPVSAQRNTVSSSQPANSTGAGAQDAPSLPDNVFERLAMRGRLKAQQIYHHDLPPPQDTFSPRISERSVRLAEKKHQRDVAIRSRSASREPGHRDPSTQGPGATDAGAEEPQYLSRNYDYYELYTMPARYMHRVENPERYKSSGTVPRNNIRNDQDRIILAESGLSKVTRARQERSGRSPSPAINRAVSSEASVPYAPPHRPSFATDSVDIPPPAPANAPDRAMRMSELSATGSASVLSVPSNAPSSTAPGVLQSNLPVKADDGGKYYTHTQSNVPSNVHAGLTIKTDEGGKYYTHKEGRPMRVPSPMHDRSQRASSPGFGQSGDAAGSQANFSVRIIAKEGIEQKRSLSRKMREQQLEDFNRRHFLSKESKESKPFQPLLLATETQRIMSRSNSTFEERTNKSVENLYVRREVSRKFPSPGPGRYTGGIGIEKLVQALSVGSPRKVERSRSCSPVPGHRGFSFGKEPLGRIDSAAAGVNSAIGSPNATLTSVKSPKPE